MTYISDKLPALSGVAKTLSTILGGTYLAGIWNNENLLEQLAWSTSRPRSSLRPRPGYTAPTWSWASIDDPVKFPNLWREEPDSFYAGYKRHTKLIQAHVDPMGADETGAVRNGFLLLQGHLRCVTQPRKEELERAFNMQFDTREEIIGDLFFLSLFTGYHIRFTRHEDADSHNFGHYLVLVRDPYNSNGYRRVGLATTT